MIKIITKEKGNSQPAQIAEEIWLKHERKIRDYCKCRLRGCYRESVDDCMQEVFIELLEYIKKGAIMKNPLALLYKIAKGKIVDIIRDKSNENKNVSYITDLFDDDEIPITYDMKSPDDDISEEALEREKETIINSLTPEEQVVLQDMVDKLTLKEAALKHNQSLSHIWRQRKDLTEKIRKMVKDRFKDKSP